MAEFNLKFCWNLIACVTACKHCTNVVHFTNITIKAEKAPSFHLSPSFVST